ncbi:Uncharacterized protein Adt_06180 [Abeliophyllum distichum]|uniref:Uncharacterized protein n=1 Tax=Abeliophyllum distichum TaxID=126358 RepID=A0ABD1V658_9LAMI
MEHLDAIKEIHRETSLNGHELCRDEAVFHLLRTLTEYWRDFAEQLDVMFDRQICVELLIVNLRERWVINNKDYRMIRRPKGYEPNHHRRKLHNESGREAMSKYRRWIARGHIIEYVPEEEENPEDESTGENF